jgi:hypothetical protein
MVQWWVPVKTVTNVQSSSAVSLSASEAGKNVMMETLSQKLAFKF